MLVTEALVDAAGFFEKTGALAGQRKTGLRKVFDCHVKCRRTLSLALVLMSVFRAADERLLAVALAEASVQQELCLYWGRTRHEAENSFVQVDSGLGVLKRRFLVNL